MSSNRHRENQARIIHEWHFFFYDLAAPIRCTILVLVVACRFPPILFVDSDNHFSHHNHHEKRR